jgi:general secretion pathway protein G
MKRIGSNSGFTLIELLIVMSILGILLTIAQPAYRQATIKAREAALKNDLATFRDVIDQYYADQTSYPPTLNDLAEKGYLRRIPTDPFTGSSDTWVEIYLEIEDGEDGIFDVHSGSDWVALNGTAYNEW